MPQSDPKHPKHLGTPKHLPGMLNISVSLPVPLTIKLSFYLCSFLVHLSVKTRRVNMA